VDDDKAYDKTIQITCSQLTGDDLDVYLNELSGWLEERFTERWYNMDKDNVSKEGEGMLPAMQEPIYKTSKTDNLKQRAEFRKQRTDLRHQATKSEVQKYNELFKDYDTVEVLLITSDAESKGFLTNVTIEKRNYIIKS
jgi:hypothetical protein